MADAISVDDTKNWEIFRKKLNAALAAAGISLSDPHTWTGLQTFAGGALIKGTTTNDNAAAGYVGEYLESEVLVAGALSLTSTTARDITTLSLTAGDWDIWGTIAFSLSGAVFTSPPPGGWLSTTSATAPALPNKGAMAQFFPNQANNQAAWAVGQRRISLTTTTTVYLSAVAGFSVGTASAYGFVGARRAR